METNKLLSSIDQIKQQIDSHRPFSPHIVQQLKEYFRIGLTWTSNALEGNSLTETETKVVLEDGLTIDGKPLRDHLEALGHSKAYDFMLNQASQKTITEETVLTLHKLFYSGIDIANAGNYRTVKIHITGTDFVFPTPTELPSLMQAFIQELPALQKEYHPVEYAALVHLKFVTIHPFIDGNGRTARLLMNLALIQHGYAITIIPPIMRSEYINALKISNKGNQQPFVDLITQMAYESHKDYLRILTQLI